MGRRPSLLALAGTLAVLGAPAAHATPVVSLVFRSTGTSTAALAAGESDVLDVILTSDVPLITATLMLRTDNALAALTGAAGSPSPFIGVAFAASPDPWGGYAVGTFGGLAFEPVGPFTLNLGYLAFTAGSTPGETAISAYRRDAIDVWYDEAFEVLEPLLGTARLIIVPETAPAALLVFGLALLAGVRRRLR